MKPISFIINILCMLMVTSVCNAAPTLTTPSTIDVAANMATLVLKSSGTGTGYFTLLSGIDAGCGTGTDVKAGKTGIGAPAPYSGSLFLTADTDGRYTVRNLTRSTAYTVCFTAESPDGSTLNPVPVSANLTTGPAVTSGIDWRGAGSQGFSAADAYYTSLAMAPDGTPYIGYMDAANNYKATVMKYGSNAWSVVGTAGFSLGEADTVSLAFAPDGTPYVAYQDWGNSARATVMKFSSGAWNAVGNAGFSAGTAIAVSLAFAPDGTPHVAYGDDGNAGKATVMRYSGGTWSVVGNSGFSAGTANAVSLAFTPDGVPFVAYGDDGNGGKAAVMKYSGGVWSTVGTAGFSAGGVSSTSLAIAPDGVPYLAYADYGNSGKATVMKFNGSTWINVGEPGFSPWEVDFTSLAIAPDGNPYVAYSDYSNSGKATAMKYSGGAWSVAGNAGFTAGVARNTSLSFAPNGTPFVAYGDDGNSGKATVMKLYTPPTNPPAISGIPVDTASVGMSYTFMPTATDAESFSVTGTLPPGLSFSTSTGALTGTPTTAGTYGNIVITATNPLGSDSLPAFSITVIDVSPPDTTITSYPANPSSSASFTFAFTSSQSGSSFECSLGGGAYFSCPSPYSGSILYPQCTTCRTESAMTFTVRAKSATWKTDPTPASHAWTIDHPLTSPIDNVLDNGVVQLKGADFTGDLHITRGVAFTLKGGYDPAYSANTGRTNIHGVVTISGGTVTVENIVVMQ